ncbi:MAG: hypothetical protein Q8M47_12785 [Devosia sp.]|jgi:hypothetical protein|nr:hypothetical protein [Devosia sp.]
MLIRPLTAATLALALLALPAPAYAQLFNSAWSELKFEDCTVVSTDDFGSTWACPGLKGLPVMVRESERRFRISYGLTSTTEKAADQTLPPVNTPGEEIEWRVSNAEGSYKPFATIVKFDVETDGKATGAVLVVTRVAPGATCHVAYVDTASPDAEKLARQAADEKAQDFDCAAEPEIIGTFAAWEQ